VHRRKPKAPPRAGARPAPAPRARRLAPRPLRPLPEARPRLGARAFLTARTYGRYDPPTMKMRSTATAAALALLLGVWLLPPAARAASDNDVFLSGLVIRCGTEDDAGVLPCFDPTRMGNPTAQDPLPQNPHQLPAFHC